MTTHEPIHYVPVVEQRYAEIVQNLEQHPARNQWSRLDRERLGSSLTFLMHSGESSGPNDTLIPMAIDLVHEVADWIPGAVGFFPYDLIALLGSYVQPESER